LQSEQNERVRTGKGVLGPYGLALGPTVKARPLNIKSINKWTLHNVCQNPRLNKQKLMLNRTHM